MKLLRYFSLFSVLCVTTACTHLYALGLPQGYDSKAEFLKQSGKINNEKIAEPSALLKSRKYADVYWTMNDSGGKAKLYAIHADGRVIPRPFSLKKDPGIKVDGAQNVDWEALAMDEENHIYIGDIGNNDSDRKDLVIYQVNEPNPYQDTEVSMIKAIHLRYADQSEFPAKLQNFDAEAMFWRDGFLYILSKHKSDSKTTLYRVDPAATDTKQVLVPLESFEVGGKCTDAALSADKSMLAILTYGAVWVHDLRNGENGGFGGRRYQKKILAKQVEGISFVDNSHDELLLLNEQSELFKLKINLQAPDWQAAE